MAKQPESHEAWEARERARLGGKQVHYYPDDPPKGGRKKAWCVLGGVVAIVVIAIGSLAPSGDTDTLSNAEAKPETREYVAPFGCEYVQEEIIRGLLYLGVEYGVPFDEPTLRQVTQSENPEGKTLLEVIEGDDGSCFWETIQGWANSNADWAAILKEEIIEDGHTPREWLQQFQAGIEAHISQPDSPDEY